MRLHLGEANKLLKELNDRKKQLKASMFGNQLASFNAFASTDESSLGELTFTQVQLPFAKVDFASSELKALDIRADYSFLLPLEDGERIVAVKLFFESNDFARSFTQMSCFDQLGRVLSTNCFAIHVQRENVVQCGPSEFVICHNFSFPALIVYNSDLKLLRHARCKDFSSICCNSKFVFGLWNTDKTYEEEDPSSGDYEADSDDDEDDDEEDYDDENSSQKIRVHHLDTLSKAFCLLVPKRYTLERIMADEHHVVALSQLENSEANEWFMSVFDLQAIGKEIVGDEKRARRFSLPERHFQLDMEWPWLEEVFLVDGWLAVPTDQQIVWFDKEGRRSETSTKLDTSQSQTIFSSRSVLLFALRDNHTLMMKRL